MKPNVICSVPLILEKVVKKQIFPMLGKGWMKAALKVPGVDSTIYNTIRKKLIHAFGGELIEVVIGGAALNAEVEEFLSRIKFPVVVGYGMTETGPLISYSGYDEGYKPKSAGRVVEPFMTARIDSPDQKNIPGEIQVTGEHVMKGYFKNDKATAEMFTEDGWFKTGDMGTMDEDNVLYIRGRYKTMILLGSGQNIYPEEIEAKLNNLNYVMESLIVEREGKLVALVVPDYEQVDQDGISHTNLKPVMEDVLKELNTLVAPYERVASVVLYPTEFEKTPKKSIRRYLYTV